MNGDNGSVGSNPGDRLSTGTGVCPDDRPASLFARNTEHDLESVSVRCASEAFSNVVQRISHDLNNGVTIARCLVDLAKDSVDDPAMTAQLLSKMQSVIDEMGERIASLSEANRYMEGSSRPGQLIPAALSSAGQPGPSC